MSEQKLEFKVGQVPRGAYNATTTYAVNDSVQADDGVYASMKSGNVGHPLTDTTWWVKVIDLAPTKAATAAAQQQAQAAQTQASAAEAAASNANEKATLAAEKSALAQQKAQEAQTAANSANAEATRAGNAATNATAAAAVANKATLEMEQQATSDHNRADADHQQAVADHTQHTTDHQQAESDHTNYTADRATFAQNEQQRQSDFTTNEGTASQEASASGSRWQRFKAAEAERKAIADADHNTATSDHAIATSDHAQAAADHETSVGVQNAELVSEVGALMADDRDFRSLPTLCGQPPILFGEGTPQEAVIPTNWVGLADGGYAWNGTPSAIGQQYINTSVNAGGRYIAVRDNNFGLKWLNF